MPKALFIVPSPHEQALPPMEELCYTEGDILKGGWWIFGEAPQPATVAVCVWTTDAMLDTMAANPDYLYVGDIAEEAV